MMEYRTMKCNILYIYNMYNYMIHTCERYAIVSRRTENEYQTYFKIYKHLTTHIETNADAILYIIVLYCVILCGTLCYYIIYAIS